MSHKISSNNGISKANVSSLQFSQIESEKEASDVLESKALETNGDSYVEKEIDKIWEREINLYQ